MSNTVRFKAKSIVTLFEDDDFIIVSKPAHLLTIPDRYDSSLPNLKTFLANRYGEIFVVHRLDKETSGVICMAKNGAAHKAIYKQFQERTAEKYYYAIVEGTPSIEVGEIEMPLLQNKNGMVMVNFAKGKNALTRYKVVEQFKDYSLLYNDLRTGRMHQIRVHLAAMGNPLAVDAMYGRNKEGFYLSSVKRKYHLGKHGVERPILGRLALHAHKLIFDHPTTGERLTFEAEMPKDMKVMLKQLRKYNVKDLF